MTDEEYRALFIARLAERLEPNEGPNATQIAEDLYEEVPRPEMAEEYRDNPVSAADDSWCDWRDRFRDDEEDDPIEAPEREDWEWDE